MRIIGVCIGFALMDCRNGLYLLHYQQCPSFGLLPLWRRRSNLGWFVASWCPRFAHDLNRFFERIDGTNEIDIDFLNVYKLVRHADKTIITYSSSFTGLNHRIYRYLLTNLFVEIRVVFTDDPRNQHVVGGPWSIPPAAALANVTSWRNCDLEISSLCVDDLFD